MKKNQLSTALLRWIAILVWAAVSLAVALLVVGVLSYRNALDSASHHLRSRAIAVTMSFVASVRSVDRTDFQAMEDHMVAFAQDAMVDGSKLHIRIMDGEGKILVSSVPEEVQAVGVVSVPQGLELDSPNVRPPVTKRWSGGEGEAPALDGLGQSTTGPAPQAPGAPATREEGVDALEVWVPSHVFARHFGWAQALPRKGVGGGPVVGADSPCKPGEPCFQRGAGQGALRLLNRGAPRPQFLWVYVPGPGNVVGVRTARVQLFLSLAVSVLLLVLAGLAYRESRRSAILGVHMERRRHLASLGEMAAVLAHEIRNPVAVARGYAQLLLERMDYEKDQAVRMPAEAVLKETERLGRLVEQLLSYARPHTPAMVPLDLSQVIRETVEVHAGMAAEKNIAIICEGSEVPVKIVGDRDMLTRLLGNLVRNGVQASVPGGTVVVQMRKGVGRLEVRVIDQGAGVPDELAERIFEPFFTTSSDGSGLGLAVARRLAEEHGATLVLENSRERQGGSQGAVFRLSMPWSLIKNKLITVTNKPSQPT